MPWLYSAAGKRGCNETAKEYFSHAAFRYASRAAFG